MDLKFVWKSFLDLLFIGFFTLLASIATITFSAVKSDSIDWVSLYNGGDFFLYSISLFSSSLIFYINRNDRQFGKYSVMILITLCALIYTQFINEQKSNTNFTRIGSFSFLFIASISFWITQYHQRLEMPDVNAQDQENQEQIVQGINFNN
jgi:hypothetical protein